MRCSKSPIQTSCGTLGFVYGRTFRQAVVVRAYEGYGLALYDLGLASSQKRLEAWLAPENFDKDGRQYKAENSERY